MQPAPACRRIRRTGLLLLAVSALSHGAEPAAGESAASSAAMQRAERQANSPMRAILKAAKGSRKPAAEPAAIPPGAAPNPGSSTQRPLPVAPLAVSPAGSPLVSPVASPVTSPVAQPVPSRTAAVTAAPTPAAAPPLPPPPPLEAVLSASDGIAHPLPVPRSPLEALAIPQAAMSSDTLPQLAELAPPVSGPVQPQLLSKVAPDIPPRLLAEIGDVTLVRFDLSLRADGSVAEATLVPPAPRQLQRVLAPALLQWRYAPLPGPQTHRVELAFTLP